MLCEEIQQSLSLYVDDGLRPEERGACYRHLEVCPVCRARLLEMRSIRGGLAMLSRPAPPADLIPSINKALAGAAATRRTLRDKTFADLVSAWLQPVMMRYAFSSLASVIIFTAVFAAMRPQMIALHEAAVAFGSGSVKVATVAVKLCPSVALTAFPVALMGSSQTVQTTVTDFEVCVWPELSVKVAVRLSVPAVVPV